MKKYWLSVFVLIIISLLIFGACDAKGRLNDKETAGLYDEVSCSTNRLVHISKYFCLKNLFVLLPPFIIVCNIGKPIFICSLMKLGQKLWRHFPVFIDSV